MVDAMAGGSPEAHAIVGALHAREYLQLIGSTLQLLSVEMGNTRHPTADQHAAWTEVAFWLSSVTGKEADDLDDALAAHDEGQRRSQDASAPGGQG